MLWGRHSNYRQREEEIQNGSGPGKLKEQEGQHTVDKGENRSQRNNGCSRVETEQIDHSNNSDQVKIPHSSTVLVMNTWEICNSVLCKLCTSHHVHICKNLCEVHTLRIK